MSRSKHGSDSKEYYKGEIRRLKKQLKKYERQEHILNEKLEDDDEPIIKDAPKKKNTCPNCEDGVLKILDLGVRLLEICDCGYRKVIKDESKKTD